jgi:predicted RNA-binding Zn ribbon-like protein
MERRDDLTPAMRRRFRTGRVSLDFTHTGGDGEPARWEILHEPSDVAQFLGIILETEPPIVQPTDMADVYGLRRAISGLARAKVAGAPEPTGAVAVINAAAGEPPLVPQLDDRHQRWLLPGTAAQALSTIASDAVGLFSSGLADKVRVCEADDCGLLFVDTSRPGTRRWCSMEWCGDRAKKRAAGRSVPKGQIQ